MRPEKLERMLQEAQSEPERLPELHWHLLETEVLVPVQLRPDQREKGTIAADSLIDVIMWIRPDGTEAIPFFTAPERLYQWSPTGANCILMYVRELFESRPDMHFHLNPCSPCNLAWAPDDVRALLAPPRLS